MLPWLLVAAPFMLLSARPRLQRQASPSESMPALPGALDVVESSVGGLHEVLLCESETKAERIVVVIPGNPGLPGFYADFAKSLASDLTADVAVVGLANHVSWPSVARMVDVEQAGRRPFILRRLFGRRTSVPWRALHAVDSQVAHLSAALAPYSRRASTEGVPLVIIGHSIGAWFAMQLLASSARADAAAPTPRFPSNTAALLVFPFLQENMNDSVYKTKHDMLLRLPWLIPIIARAAGLLRRAPAKLRRRALRSQVKGMDEKYVALVESGFLHVGAAQNMLHLARSEMRALAGQYKVPAELDSVVQAGRVRALYIDRGDEWAPLTAEEQMRAQGVRTSVRSADVVSHSFSCNASDTRVVAAWVAETMREIDAEQ